jgi:hypothetical protein
MRLGPLSVCIVLALTLASGCKAKLKVTEVTGQITQQGKPLELVHVEFWPTAGMRSFGKTDSEGRFTLQLDDRSAAGAVPGTHKVILRDTWHMQDDYIDDGGDWVDNSKGRKSRISSKYSNAESSDLSASVTLGQPNHFTFEIEANKR